MRLIRASQSSRAVALWLFVVAFLVFAMVVVGGATRLTDSGLSITEWKPVTGAVPPLSHTAWLAAFEKYQHIPQYRLVNPHMTLGQFQTIYWWEWAHRMLGRLVGVVFAIPFLAFLVTRRMPRRLVWRAWVLLALGGLQGLVGWWMVASGLSDRVSVAPERLALHLGLALVLFSALVWTGLEAWSGEGQPARRKGWARAAIALLALVFLQILMGALVAGNDAGLVYNDWPLMGGRMIPADYWEAGQALGSLLHSQAAVQFNHRLAAYLLTGSALAASVAAARASRLAGATRGLFLMLLLLVLAQASLGVVTLVSRAPLGLSLSHQALAVLVLGVAVALAWRVRRA